MLRVCDLININYVPNEKEISLKLLVDFYEQYLCRRIFIFTLKNGEVVKLFFKDASEIYHISGIDHIYDGIPMDGSRFLKEIQSGKTELETVEKVNAVAYTDYIDRIRSMFCIDTIIKNCEYLYYSDGKIPESNIKVTYLLLKGLDGKSLHLGIDTYRKGRPYFTRTLLVTEGNNAMKFVNKADEKLKVTKLEICDKDTNEVVETVKREEAVVVVRKLVDEITEKWIQTEFEENISNFMIQPEVVYKIDVFLKNKEKNDVDSNIWMQFLQKIVPRTQKNIWINLWRSRIDEEKVRIRNIVDSLDPYWSGKIVGEEIRKFEKNEFSKRLQKIVNCYLEDKIKSMKHIVEEQKKL